MQIDVAKLLLSAEMMKECFRKRNKMYVVRYQICGIYGGLNQVSSFCKIFADSESFNQQLNNKKQR